MEYHKPAAQWNIFGIPDFESYCEKSVVKGLFHKSVPKDVVDAYEVAEYMMAHAYYHYPLYEEAFSKLLRITEMAVKLRCKELGIDLTATKIVKNKPVVVDKNFNSLINELSSKEPLKNIKAGLHWLREKRNSHMHPDSHTYMGSMTYGIIKVGVTVLNKIFIPEQNLLSFRNQLATIQTHLSSFNQGPSVFIKKGYLIERIEVRDALQINGKWFYFVLIHPITDQIAVQIEKNDQVPPETFVVDEFFLDAEKLTMRDVNTTETITCYRTTKPENIATYNLFITERNAAEANIIRFSFIPGDMPVGKHNDFLYEWLWKVA